MQTPLSVTDISDDALFTVAETCKFLRCCRENLLLIRKQGKIEQVITPRGRVFIQGAAIKKYLNTENWIKINTDANKN
ncbi:MAG: hypothetical protein ABIU77_27740 [Ferruginibacter sp.]